VALELRIDQSPVTRDVAAATRDLALALVSQAMAAMGTDRTPKVRIVEGRDQGAVLAIAEEDRPYLIGRAPHCDLVLEDPDSSREHIVVAARGGAVFLRDKAAKNGTFMGDVRLADDREVVWRTAIMVRIGRTVLALEEPVSQALAELERAEDEPVPMDEAPAPPVSEKANISAFAGGAPITEAPSAAVDGSSVEVRTRPASVASRASPSTKPRPHWSAADLLVMAAALSVLALSLAGLVWLLRG
jgi:pSer/pThr/pTyr-binding forkhead associated (FHA) protein